MKSFIPPDMANSSVSELIQRGVPKSLATRIATTKCLWLVRMSPEDIAKFHEADLFGKYNTEGQNLDVVEMAAVFSVLPELFLNDSLGKKEAWRARMEDKLRRLISDQENGTLSPMLQRHSAYRGLGKRGQFADCENIISFRGDMVSGKDAYAPRSSFKKLALSSQLSSRAAQDSGVDDEDGNGSRDPIRGGGGRSRSDANKKGIEESLL
jgi:hypothetical protein